MQLGTKPAKKKIACSEQDNTLYFEKEKITICKKARSLSALLDRAYTHTHSIDNNRTFYLLHNLFCNVVM